MIRLLAIVAAVAGFGTEAVAFPKLPVVGTGRPRVDALGDPLPERAIARLGSARFRHQGPLVAVTFSPDGKLVAAGSARPSVVRIWDRPSGKLLDQWWFIDQAPPEELVFSPDGKRLYAGRLSERERLWSAWDIGRRIATDLGPAGEGSVPFQMLAPDGRHALYAAGEKLIGWNLETDRQAETFTRPERDVLACAFARDIGWVAVCYDGAKFTVTRLNNNKRLWSVEGGWIGSLPDRPAVLAPDAQRVAVHTRAGRLTLFETASGKRIKDIEGPGTIQAMRFSPDDTTLAVTWKHEGVRVYDVSDGKERVRLSESCGSPVSLAFAPDSKSLATADPDGARAVLFFDATRGTPIAAAPGHTTPIDSMAVAPDGKLVATAARPGGEPLLSVWDVNNGQTVWSSNDGRVSGLAFSPDGMLLAGLRRSTSKPVRLWDARTGRVSRDIEFRGEASGALAFASDGALIFGTGQRVRQWDLRSGKFVGNGLDLPHGVDRILTSPGLRQAIAATPAVFTCNLETGKFTGPVIPLARTQTGFALSPDGRLLATADGSHVVHIWEVLTWYEAAAIKFPDPVFGLAVSPAGHTLAAATAGGTVLHDLPTASTRAKLFSGPSADTRVAFSADGRRLVTAGNRESFATVWDVADLLEHPASGSNTKSTDCASCWVELMNSDPKVGYAAAWKLVAAPDRAVPFLAEQLGKAVPDTKQIARLIANLDSPRFAVRERAARQLLEAGEAAVGALHEARKGKLSAEQAERVDGLVKKLDGPRPAPDRLRISRAVAALEMIGSDQARAVLKDLARGPDSATLTKEVRAALARWR